VVVLLRVVVAALQWAVVVALVLETVVAALTLKGVEQLLEAAAAAVLGLGLDVGQPLIHLSED